MRISCVKVNNYRNIDGIEVTFNPECNYIIGENNIGKSNFLTLLATVCNGKSFDEKDFADSEKPIEVELDIKLLPNEQGFFGDNFSPEDASLLKIRYHQTIRDAYPTIVSADSNESIPPKQLRKLNFLKYETTSVPTELCFEIEIVKTLFAAGKTDLVRAIALDMDNNACSVPLDANFVRNHFKK